MKNTSAELSPPGQPFNYPLTREFVEPDWTRLPGFKGVTAAEWENAVWQRKNTVKNLRELKEVFGALLPDELAADIEVDQQSAATMSILITPQMLNTMNVADLREDPLRRYMLPAASDRHSTWRNHPRASRDSLHEAEMWKIEGLTHRYPTKVLAELLSTCPQ
jgi:lysine 2,3-aminomutase